ncbi:MAG TPA: cbb3-type cytochrome c oxidase subunit I [Rickettsia endosymbiont of Pyrocoelia pectoralis]|nr:cbb3-type cytochrome c oxidase subunit I [Rickettsia endosymbiont of Pyrocoelia pectoralis]
MDYQHINNYLIWLKIGIISLGFAGLYSIILVVLRTPQLASFFSNPHIFKSALIIHVNLSVLIWLLSITASVWSLSFPQKRESRKTILDSRFRGNDIMCKLALLATLLIAISPVAGHNPVMNNYIPMLENIVFILGLSLFGVTLLLYAINILYFFDFANWNNFTNFTILSTIIMFLLTWVCFWCSYRDLHNVIQIIPIEIEFYYELLFWSGGHLLQFIYTQIAMFIWVSLLQKLVAHELRFQKFYLLVLCLNFIFGMLIIWGHISYNVIDGSFKEFYTNHMKYLGGIAPVLCLGGMGVETLVIPRLDRGIQKKYKNNIMDTVVKPRYDTVIKATLLCSATLFLFGGLIAMNISGINVVIPAHYHGSIVGISIACMGYCYLGLYVIPAKAGIQKKLLERMDSRFRGNDIISFTIYLLTFGQIVHILGLALAGGYGVMRKDPNIVMPLSAKLLMGMMGGGGLIAIVGGLMFVFICGKIIFFRNK